MSNERHRQGLYHDVAAQARNVRDRTTDKVETERNEVEHRAEAHTAHTPRADLQLSARVTERQQRMAAGHDSEDQALTNRHNLKRRELMNVHAADRQEVTQTREADRRVEMETLNRFQNIQREQLTERQQLEQRIVHEHMDAVADLDVRQRQQLVETQQHATAVSTDIAQKLVNGGQQLEMRHQQERQQLVKYFDAQLRALKEHRDALKTQMEQDQKALQQALYGERQDADRHAALKHILEQQETTRNELVRTVEDRLFSASAQKAFDSRFSETPAIRAIWQDASNGLPNTAKGFDKAREKFWSAINNSAHAHAEAVRKILAEAGYELQGGAKAPLLKMQEWDRRASREIADRRLTIDHADPQSVTAGKILRSDNLRFMSQRDNSSRWNRHNEDDRLTR